MFGKQSLGSWSPAWCSCSPIYFSSWSVAWWKMLQNQSHYLCSRSIFIGAKRSRRSWYSDLFQHMIAAPAEESSSLTCHGISFQGQRSQLKTRKKETVAMGEAGSRIYMPKEACTGFGTCKSVRYSNHSRLASWRFQGRWWRRTPGCQDLKKDGSTSDQQDFRGDKRFPLGMAPEGQCIVLPPQGIGSRDQVDHLFFFQSLVSVSWCLMSLLCILPMLICCSLPHARNGRLVRGETIPLWPQIA